MKLTYDLDADALYIHLRDGIAAATDAVDDQTNVDVDGKHHIIGIEVISPERMWPLDIILRRYDIDTTDARQLLVIYPGHVIKSAGDTPDKRGDQQ